MSFPLEKRLHDSVMEPMWRSQWAVLEQADLRSSIRFFMDPTDSYDSLPHALGEGIHDKRRSSHPEVWNSFGFVEVGEQRDSQGEYVGYPMKRTKSSLFAEASEENISANYKLLENRLLLLQREVGTIKRKLDVFEEDSGKSIKWGVKYTRTSPISICLHTSYIVF